MGFFGFKKKSKTKKAGFAKKDDKKNNGAGAGAASAVSNGENNTSNNTTNNAAKTSEQPISAAAAAAPPPPPQNEALVEQTTTRQQTTTPTQTPTPQVVDIPAGDPAYARADVTRELVKQFISEVWNRGEIESIPKFCSPKIRLNGQRGLDKIGHEGFAHMVSAIHSSFQDYHCEIHSMVVEDNKAFCRLRYNGTFLGPLMGFRPHGKKISWMGATEFTCQNGLILKVWELGDMKTLEEQLADENRCNR